MPRTLAAAHQVPEPFVAPDVEASGPPTIEELAAGLCVGTGLRLGQYRVDVRSGRWWWSPEIERMHGYSAGSVTPSLEVLRQHQHSAERGRLVREALAALRSGMPFACAHRIVDAQGRNHSLVVTGQARRGRLGPAGEIVGYVIDLTPVEQEAVERKVRRAIDAAYVSAAAVERARGVLMAVYGVGEEEAHAMLLKGAGGSGAGLRGTAEQVMASLREGGGMSAASRSHVEAAFGAVVPHGRPHAREAHLARRHTN